MFNVLLDFDFFADTENNSFTDGSCYLKAFISQQGLHGEIVFSRNKTNVEIRTHLSPTLEHPEQIWAWSIHQFPVDYRLIDSSRCSDENLGAEVINLTEQHGFLFIPDNQTTIYNSKGSLLGSNGLWGKSIVLKDSSNKRICSSIVAIDKQYEKLAFAKFSSSISGSVTFRWIASENYESADINILSDLYYTKPPSTSQSETIHKWKIYATDIFDIQSKNLENECNVLQSVFDPDNKGENKAVGDLDVRLGMLRIAVSPTKKKSKVSYSDDGLTLLPSDMERSRRSLYIVVFDEKHPDSFLACAKIRPLNGKLAK